MQQFAQMQQFQQNSQAQAFNAGAQAMGGQQPQGNFTQNQLPSVSSIEEKKEAPGLPPQFEGKLPLPHFNF